MEDIDKLTLELLMNKSNYQKYLNNTNPQRAEENIIHKEKLRKYSQQIVEQSKKYLDNPDSFQITLEINEMMETFGKTWIKYFETKELENPQLNNRDDDVLFDPNTINSKNELSTYPNNNSDYPFLNKNLKYSMDYYARKNR